MFSKTILYYGQEKPPPQHISLNAGPLKMIFEPEGVFLRYIRLGNKEILRGIYAAVRDLNWNTVTPQVSNLQIESAEASFSITFDVQCSDQDLNLDFRWKGTIDGQSNGTIIYKFDGVAQSTFLRNRIGFCVLHSVESAGAEAHVGRVDGTLVADHLPVFIAPQLIIDGLITPHRPFHEMRSLTHQVQGDLWAHVDFEGDIFELEDQRNWTDASYKTYCTPLRLPFPVEVKNGAEIHQKITLSLQGTIPREIVKINSGTVFLERAKTAPLPLPSIGLGIASHEEALTELEISRLRNLHLSHLRVNLKLQQPTFETALQRAVVESKQLDVLLEIALHFSDNTETELQILKNALLTLKPKVKRWLIHHINHKSTPERTFLLTYRHLKDYDTHVQFGAGSDAYFTELNRHHPTPAMLELMDFVCYSINPQVHAFDNASLIETLALQGATVTSARHYLGKPVVVTPVTLKPRFNPNATGDEPERNPDTLPAEVDERQMSLFGAIWTLGSIKYLAESGADSVTYFETTGWRGLMEKETGAPIPHKFHSIPGAVFPLYHVMVNVAEFSGGEVLTCCSSHNLCIDGLMLRHNGHTRILIANMILDSQPVTLKGIPDTVHIRRLNENNVEDALRNSEEFRVQQSQAIQTIDNTLSFDLHPYEICWIDC